jgi:glycosyltransferase involved in cell wall biosynthesis
VCHLIGGDQWAGAEVQCAHLLDGLGRCQDLDRSAILFSEGRLADELRGSGVPVSVVEPGRGPGGNLLAGVAGALRARPVDILHTHGYKANIVGGIAGRRAGVRWFVRTEHGYTEPFEGFDRLKMGMYKAVDYLVGRFATDWTIAVSHEMYSRLVRSFPGQRVALIQNGIVLDRVVTKTPASALRAQFGLAAHTPAFGTAGRLVAVKGIEYFLAAARGILEALPDARFFVVGEGPLLERLKARAREGDVDSAVEFTGFRRDAVDLVNMMDVFVLPSLSEGLPMVLLEALALGTPIVASAVGGIPEIVRPPDGWLVPPRDATALTRACLEAYAFSRTPARKAIGQDRRDELEAAASTMCHQTWALYQDLARRTNPFGLVSLDAS